MKKQGKTPEKIVLTPEQADALQARVKLATSSLSKEDIKILTGLIDFSLWLHNQLGLAKLTIRRLKGFFGFATEKKSAEEDRSCEQAANDDESQQDKSSPSNPKGKANRNPKENHGRYGAADYPGCEQVKITHGDLKAGDPCPECSQVQMKGKLCLIKPGVLIKLHGNPLVTGRCYQIEKLRCGLCNHQYTAKIPEEVSSQAKYSPSCRSILAIGHYQLGLPFKRIESWQAAQGVPLADATQWDQISELHEIVKPVHETLETLAAQGRLFHYDDTPHKILSQLQAHQQGDLPRKGIYSTAVISQVEDKVIYLFCTGARYAGENIGKLLEKRDTDEPLTLMSDASAMNHPKSVRETLLARWIICYCLVHGRRKFHEIKDMFKAQSHFVLDVISQVYQHEAHCKAQDLNAEQRLLYHQKHSGPLMKSLYIWLNNQLVYEQVESNSGLGQAVNYLVRHWAELTRFLHHAGVPIDNNWSERTLKVVLRYRKNSLFFKTDKGAAVSDCMMSLIQTCIGQGVEVFEYFNQLQTHAQAVALCPEHWLPWNYQIQLAQVDKAA